MGTRWIAVSLEDTVPSDHFARHLDRSLDLSFVCNLVQIGCKLRWIALC